MSFYIPIKEFCNEIVSSFDLIPPQRKELLNNLSFIIDKNCNNDEVLNLIFVCTHNSRRSQFANIWGYIASIYYDLPLLKIYSCGTEESSLNINVLNTSKKTGFKVFSGGTKNSNINYQLFYSDNNHIECYSKKIFHPSLPKTNIISVMTCSDADQNCPIIPNSIVRFSMTYDDPKIYDNTKECGQQYKQTESIIAREIFYVFSKIQLL